MRVSRDLEELYKYATYSRDDMHLSGILLCHGSFCCHEVSCSKNDMTKNNLETFKITVIILLNDN